MLRNSAKLPRKFARRGALAIEPQKIGLGNCLTKTQLYAKPQGDVYEVMPAQCWKVKRIC